MTKTTILLLLLSIFSIHANAKIFYVDSANVGSTAQSGQSWATAYSNLQTAINFAQPGDSVWVATGTYKPPAGAYFYMRKGVKIYGGFLNTHETHSQRNFRLNKTILRYSSGGNSVIRNYQNGLTNSALLDGFIITKGSTQGGGGMFNYESSPSIVNCTFIENKAVAGVAVGGGIYNINSSPIIINCSFIKNSAPNGGGGIFNNGSVPTIINCVFLGNEANSQIGGGVAIANSPGVPSITNCTFYGNQAIWGGGIYNYQSPTIISNTIVWGNSSGLLNDDTSDIVVTYSLIQNYPADAANHNLDSTINPLFIDSDLDNFQLQDISPCVNTGSNSAYIDAGGSLTLDEDLNGNNRLAGVSIDIGAYENFNQPTGINDDFDISNTNKIYPNPSTTTATLIINNKTLIGSSANLVDSYGRLIKVITLKEKQQLSMSELASGLYFLKLKDGEVMKIVRR